jgi:hypothetical protein
MPTRSGKETPEEYAERKEREQEEYEERQQLRNEALREKERLIARAASISRSTEWKHTGEEMKSLMEEWKEAGSAGKDENDRLWHEFQAARQPFYDNRERHFDELKRKAADAQRAKQHLIDRAKSLSKSDDWKGTHEQFNELRQDWKEAGRASSKEEDNALWAEFNTAIQNFYDRRKKHFSDRAEKAAKIKATKQLIINKVRGATRIPTDWRTSHETLKNLHEEYKAAGFAGLDDQALWHEYQDLRQRFYDAWNEHRAREERLRAEQKGQPRPGIFESKDYQRSLQRSVGQALGNIGVKTGGFLKDFDPFKKENIISPGKRRYDDRDQPIGHWPTKREQTDYRRRVRLLDNEFRSEKVEQHHSDFKFMGGDPAQPTTPLKASAHRLAHDDAMHYCRLRGLEIGGKSKQSFDSLPRYLKIQIFAEMYVSEDANGGARNHSEAARDFFAQHPEELEPAKKRVSDEKNFLNEGAPQEYFDRLLVFHANRFTRKK